MNLLEFAEGVKEILRDKIGGTGQNLIRHVGLGEYSKKFKFTIDGLNISIKSPFESAGTIFNLIKRTQPQKDYQLTLKTFSEGKGKEFTKRYSTEVELSEAKKDLLYGNNVDRVIYQKISCEEFAITFSEYEGTNVKLNSSDSALRMYRTILGLFPYADISSNVKDVEVNCVLITKRWDNYSKEEKIRGDVKCSIILNGKIAGTQANSFVI